MAMGRLLELGDCNSKKVKIIRGIYEIAKAHGGDSVDWGVFRRSMAETSGRTTRFDDLTLHRVASASGHQPGYNWHGPLCIGEGVRGNERLRIHPDVIAALRRVENMDGATAKKVSK